MRSKDPVVQIAESESGTDRRDGARSISATFGTGTGSGELLDDMENQDGRPSHETIKKAA